MVDRHFCVNGHTIHLGVEQTRNGWDVKEELDSMEILELRADLDGLRADIPHR
jgi:hypothetical protein